jgi:hypothetical protein
MEREGMAGEVLRLPFVFVPNGAEAPAAWRAAHPEAVSLPARLVVRGGVQRVQFVLRRRAMPPPKSGTVPRDPAMPLARWLLDWWRGIVANERFDEQRSKPPPGSRPINQTPWAGDHGKIKEAIGSEPDDDVSIAPDGTVWGENPDGSWTNHGPAENFIEGSRPDGRRGKDRDQRRQQQRPR